MSNYAALKIVVDWDAEKVKKGYDDLKRMFNSGGGNTGAEAASSAFKELKKNVSESKDTLQSYLVSNSIASKEGQRLAAVYNDLAAKQRQVQATTKGTQDAYARLSQITNEATRHAQNLGVQFGTNSDRFTVAAARANALTEKLKEIDTATGRNFRNVGNYAGATAMLGTNMSRIVGEMPNFTMSMRTGFMAISNNIQPLAESIQLLKQRNAELIAQGKPAQSVFKTIAGALFSWQTAMMVGVTLLTAYGPELVEWAKGLTAAGAAAKRAEESQKALNKAFDDANKQAGSEIGRLVSLSAIIDSNTASQERKKRAYDEVVKLYPEYASMLNDEYSKTKSIANIIKTELIPAIIASARARAMQTRIEELAAKNIDIQSKIPKEAAEYAKEVAKRRQAEGAYKYMGHYESVGVGFYPAASPDYGNDKAKLKTINSLISEQVENMKEIDRLAGDIAANANKTVLTEGVKSVGEKSAKATKEHVDKLAEAIKKYKDELAVLDKENEGGFIASLDYAEKKVSILSAAFKNLYVNLKQGFSTPAMVEIADALSAGRTNVAAIKKEAEDEKARKEQEKKDKEFYEKALQDYATFEMQKNNLVEKYAKLRKVLHDNNNHELDAVLTEAESAENAKLVNANSAKIASMTKFANDAVYLTKKAVEQQIEILQNILKGENLNPEVIDTIKGKIDNLKNTLKEPTETFVTSQLDSDIEAIQESLKKMAESGDVASDEFKRLNNELRALKKEKAEKSLTEIAKALKVLSDLAPAIQDLGSAIEQSGSTAIRQIGGVFTGLAGGVTSLVKALDTIEQKGVTSLEAISSDASFVISSVANIVSSAQAQKKALEEAYIQNLAYQNAYNNALLDEIRLREGIRDSVFFTDYSGKIKAGLAAEIAAVKEYNDALAKLSDSEVITGTKKVRNWGKVLAATGAGAAAGATTGAVAGLGIASIPGAVVGGVIGGVVGLVSGMLQKREVVNTYGDLLKNYPKLIDEEGKLNKAMAESLLTSGKVVGASKENLSYLVSMNEQFEKAKEQIESVISDLAGQLGSDLMNSLFEDWSKGGENVGNAFADGVKKSIANTAKNLLYQSLFGDDLTALQDKIRKGFKDTGDPSAMITALIDFYKEAQSKGKTYQDALSEFEKQLKAQGIDDVFGILGETTRSAVNKGLAAMSQDTANELNGRFTAIQEHTFYIMNDIKGVNTTLNLMYNENVRIGNLSVDHLGKIRENTDRLESIQADMRAVKDGISDINLKGITLK